jgi:p-hydroxybenzoate 3-monooxygenase
MTNMLHKVPGRSDFENRRTIGELDSVVSSRFGQQYLAEAYTGWPHGL